MSAEESLRPGKDRLPTFELVYRYDDPDDPAEVTIFAEDAGNVTAEWVSADPRDAVPLEHVA